MPRIVSQAFRDEFPKTRDALVALAQHQMTVSGPAFRAVSAWLGAEFSEAKLRAAIEAEYRERENRDYAQPTPPQRSGEKPAARRGVPGDGLRADRLERAFRHLLRENRGDDLTRLLSPNLPRQERELSAVPAIVVCAAIIDPDADKWLTSVTDLASAGWRTDLASTPPIRGRAEVCRGFGHDALLMLDEAGKLLGWRNGAVQSVDQPSSLQKAFDRFYRVFDATTSPETNGDRRVAGAPHAVALSDATRGLMGAIGETYLNLVQKHGVPLGGRKMSLQIEEADSPDGPWTPVPDTEVVGTELRFCGPGIDPLIIAALHDATAIAAFPKGKWDALQATQPGAKHQRWHAGELITSRELGRLDAVAKLLGLGSPVRQAPPSNAYTSIQPQPEVKTRHVFKRPVSTAAAGKTMGVRTDLVYNRLRNGGYPTGGTARRPVGELEDIIELYPHKKKQLMTWADAKYPAAE